MHPKVEAYLAQKEAARNAALEAQEAKRKAAYAEKKRTFLLREQLCEFVPNPDQTQGYTPEFPACQTDPDTNKGIWGKMSPIEITDEEYELLLAATNNASCKNEDTTNSNKVASLLQAIAYIIYCAAGLTALILFLSGDENLWPFAFAAIPTGLISGTSFLGFAEIIKQLHQINHKIK